jgi:hypothetical protein
LHSGIIPSLVQATQIYDPDIIQYYSINILALVRIQACVPLGWYFPDNTVVYNFSSDYARSSLHTVVRSKDDVNDIFIIICFCFRPSERQAPFSTAPYHLWLVQFREDRQDLDEQGDCGTLFKRKGNGILGCQLGWFAVTTAEMNDLFVEWMTE